MALNTNFILRKKRRQIQKDGEPVRTNSNLMGAVQKVGVHKTKVTFWGSATDFRFFIAQNRKKTDRKKRTKSNVP